MGKIVNTNQANSILSDNPLGVYTYCLTRTRVSFPHTMIGIDDTHGVYLAERDGIFAVLSNVSLKEYSEAALNKNMTDMVWLIPRAKRHEEVIEFVMTYILSNQNEVSSPLHKERWGEGEIGREREFFAKYYTPLVPLRFCTIYKNQEGIFKTIMPHKEKILNFLDYTADKTEWSVKVFCDKEIFVKYSDKNKEPSATTDQTSLLPGESYLLAKKMRKIKEENFRQDLQMYLKDIDFTLSQFADSYRFLQCTDKSIHGRPLDMVMNTAFLVEQQTFNMFKDTLDMLTEKYRNEGLAFEFSGPWPPYNFCPGL